MTRKYKLNYKGERYCLNCGAAFPYHMRTEKFCCAHHRDAYNARRRKLEKALKRMKS